MLLLIGACSSMQPAVHRQDAAAEAIIARLRQVNAGLVQFKCIGKISLAQPDQPVQSFRAAIAGRLNDRLRIDLLAPFGGAAGTVASDGTYLYLAMHPTRDYYKRRYRDGSLQRFVHMDITVNDLLELLVGRIPLEEGSIARSMPPEPGTFSRVELADRRGHIRQRITLDGDGYLMNSIWFDRQRNPLLRLNVGRQRKIGDYVLPSRIELSATGGQRLSVNLDRYEANPAMEEELFALPPM